MAAEHIVHLSHDLLVDLAGPARKDTDREAPTMSRQQGRRDPQPMSRGAEVAAVVLTGVLLHLALAALAALAALTGLALASAPFGGGWVWPAGSDTTGQVLAGLLTGEPGRGLPSQLQARVPGPGAVYSGVAAAELLMLTAAGTAAALFWRYHRPGDARGGMATRSEAQQVLGRSRLRQARTIIRPDLYAASSRSTLVGRGVATHSRSAR